MNTCASLYFLAGILAIPLPPELALVTFGASFLLFAIPGAVYLSLLRREQSGRIVGVTMALCSLAPMFGIILVGMTSDAVTGELRQNGVKVGLLGARMSTLPEAA